MFSDRSSPLSRHTTSVRHFVSIACLCPRHGPFISPPQCCETAHYRHEYTGPPMTCPCCRTRISRTLKLPSPDCQNAISSFQARVCVYRLRRVPVGSLPCGILGGGASVLAQRVRPPPQTWWCTVGGGITLGACHTPRRYPQSDKRNIVKTAGAGGRPCASETARTVMCPGSVRGCSSYFAADAEEVLETAQEDLAVADRGRGVARLAQFVLARRARTSRPA